MRDEYLSPNFKLSEMIQSSIAERYELDNTPDEKAKDNLTQLCRKILQPIRDRWGKIAVESGFRSEELNIFVKGAVTSQHRYGQAADFYPIEADARDVLSWIIYESMLPFDQVIDEIALKGVIHVSHTYNRREVLVQTGEDEFRNYHRPGGIRA